jgi:FAD binding domain-containing protein
MQAAESDPIRVWNYAVDLRPAVVVSPTSVDEIGQAITHRNDLEISVLGGGHDWAGRSVRAGGLTIDLRRMRDVTVDPAARVAEIGGGATAADVIAETSKHGLVAATGTVSSVGLTGLTLGGGYGLLDGNYGMAVDNVLSADVVLADGRHVRTDAQNDPDLFWALRGGGGGYAVVTALQLDLLPIEAVYAGALAFPAQVGADAVRTYRDWAAEQPDEVSSVVRFVTPPPIPDVPEPIRGVPLLTIDGASIGSQEEGEAAYAPLREIGETIIDTFGWMPAAGLSRIHMDPENPVPGIGEGGLVGELSDEAIDAFVGLAGPESGSPLLLSELRQLGGAFGRPAENSGALEKLDADFVMYSVGMPMTPELGAAIPAHLEKIGETMKPWGAEGGYFNFVEAPCEIDAIMPSDVCDRLRAVKGEWDPEGRIVANHTVTVGEA